MGTWKEGWKRLSSSAPQSHARADRCADCGYALVGLSVTTLCPECGSAATNQAGEASLQDADPAYLRRVMLGLALAPPTLCLGVAALGMTIAAFAEATPWLDRAADQLAVATSLIAASFGLTLWIIGAPGPRPMTGPRRRSPSLLTRVAGGLGAIGAAGLAGLLLLDAPNPVLSVVGGVSAGLLVAAGIGVMSLGAQLATQAGDEVLARDFQMMRLVLPICGIVGAAAFFGPFIATGVLWWLLLRLRSRVHESLKAASGE